jgi:peptidoglycan hydrolase-like protein with peptidoglycan-binding domain
VTPHRDLSSTVHWRRSLRASRERRAAAARRRRRHLRGRAGALVTGLALTGLAGVAVAQDGIVAGGASPVTDGADTAAAPATTSSTVNVRALQRRLGVTVDGVMGPETRRAVKRFQRRHGLKPDGVVGPRTRRALGLPAVSRTPRSGVKATRVAAPSATLARIADCESGGDPTAVSADGQYRGKYQFDRATWRALGGSGDPAEATEAEQDERAAALLARSGTAPWPSCAA